jgi:hypothetical protein
LSQRHRAEDALLKRILVSFGAAACLLVGAGAGAASAGTIDGVLTSYVSGNEGTDMTVKTRDGRTHAFWFDNLKKPTFEGKQLPWCPDFPCDGWPKLLVIGKTRVHVTYLAHDVDGKVVDSPTRIDLLH